MKEGTDRSDADRPTVTVRYRETPEAADRLGAAYRAILAARHSISPETCGEGMDSRRVRTVASGHQD